MYNLSLNRLVQYSISLALAVSPLFAQAQSNVGAFNSVVTIQGPVTQTATGSNVTQDLNVGSAQKSQTNSFSSVVTTGSIAQTGRNGAQQTINVGGMNNSKADRFDARVTTGNIEQVANRGERQELDIGSVSNSTVSGSATTRVSVGSIKQTGEGEIALGAVKNSNVQQFQSNLSVKGKLEGNNIRMGSVVGQERYNNRGRDVGREPIGTEPSPSLQMPDFGSTYENKQKSLFTGQGAISSLQSPGFISPAGSSCNIGCVREIIAALGTIKDIDEALSLLAKGNLLGNLIKSSVFNLASDGIKLALIRMASYKELMNTISAKQSSLQKELSTFMKPNGPRPRAIRGELKGLSEEYGKLAKDQAKYVGDIKKLDIGAYLSAFVTGVEAVDLLAKTAAGQATIQDTEAPAYSALIAASTLGVFKNSTFATFGTALATVKAGVAAGELAARLSGAMTYDDAHKATMDALKRDIDSSTTAGLELLKMGRDGVVTEERARELAMNLSLLSSSTVNQIAEIVENRMGLGSVFTSIISGRIGKLSSGADELVSIQKDVAKFDYDFYYQMFKLGREAASNEDAIIEVGQFAL